jgi:hypothetical protein
MTFEYLRAFLRICYEAAWIDANPALALRPTKVSLRRDGCARRGALPGRVDTEE